ncbi:MAG: hypothetical protein ACI9T9_000355 [Oleiphilaceae bacterium]|jgi:hypothetical protein
MLNWNSTVSRIYHYTCLTLGLALSQPALASGLAKSISEASLMQKQGAASQEIILSSQNTTQKLLAEFQALNKELDQLKINQAHLQQTQTQQAVSMRSLQKQLNSVASTEKSIIPHLLSMIDWLDDFIAQDIPFHQEERQQRINYLKTSIIEPNTSLPERYRRVLEAYQIESEFGYTIEAYPNTITLTNTNVHVKLLRIGRVGLYYQSEDGHRSGYWDHKKGVWHNASIDSTIEISDEIKQGLLIAQKQRPHSLLSLPVTK